jgi:hypothetical protein
MVERDIFYLKQGGFMNLISWYMANAPVIGGILLAIIALDHALAAIPSIQANSTFQLISNILIKLSGFISGGSQPPQAG